MITLSIPLIPPSTNTLYFNNRFTGGRSLSKDGNLFKMRIRDYVIEHYLPQLQSFNSKAMFAIDIEFVMDWKEIFSSTYGKNKKTQSPYKRKDVGNLEKLIIDSIKDFFMEDDCQIFSETLSKIPSDKWRGMRIHIREMDLNSSLLENEIKEEIEEKINAFKEER